MRVEGWCLREFIDSYDNVDDTAISKWPCSFTPFDGTTFPEHLPDEQKSNCFTVSKLEITKRDIARKFVPVGVRWLGVRAEIGLKLGVVDQFSLGEKYSS